MVDTMVVAAGQSVAADVMVSSMVVISVGAEVSVSTVDSEEISVPVGSEEGSVSLGSIKVADSVAETYEVTALAVTVVMPMQEQAEVASAGEMDIASKQLSCRLNLPCPFP